MAEGLRGRLLAGHPAAVGGTETNALLIVDAGLGFAFWLGQALDIAGYVSLPAQNMRAAVELLTDEFIAEGLVMDACQTGAAAFVAGVRKIRPELKAVAALPESGGRPPDLQAFDAA